MLYVVQPKLNWKSSTARGGKLQIEKRCELKKKLGKKKKAVVFNSANGS